MPQRRAVGGDGAQLPPLRQRLAAAVLWSGVLLGVWIAVVGEADRQDDIAGIVVAAAGVTAAWSVSLRGRAVPTWRRSDVRLLAGMVPKLCAETGQIYVATWRRARGRGRTNAIRTMSTDVYGSGWTAARRSGIVGALLSFTPATIVIDIDAETGIATVHDFVAAPEQ